MGQSKGKAKEGITEDTDLVSLAIDQLNKRWGAGSVLTAASRAEIDAPVLSTSVPKLDAILGNDGLVMGKIVEISGLESSGKSTLCLQIVAEAQRKGLKVLYIDQEQVLDPEYAAKLGVDISAMLMAQPSSMEEALSIMESLTRTGKVDVVVLDSIAALVPQDEIDKDVTEQTMGIQPRLMSAFLRRFNPVLAKTNTLIIFTNQLRDKLGGYGGTTTPGGKAIKFYASYRLQVKVIERLKTGGVQIGNRLSITTIKNKFAAPFQQASVDLYFGSGIDTVGDTLEAAENLGIIAKSGNWYSINDDSGLSFSDESFNGRMNAIKYLREHPEAHLELKALVKKLDLG